MAIVVYGGTVAGIRGSIGGCTYSANKSGPYIRPWARPSTRRHTLQVVARRVVGTNAQGWASLSPGDKALWIAFAADPAQEQTNALGQAYYLSGFQWYVKMNGWLATCARGPVSIPDSVPIPVAPLITGLAVTAGAAASLITYGAGEFGPTYDCVIEMVLGMTLGKLAPPSAWKVIKGAQVPGGFSLLFTSEVVARFGGAWVGQRAFARVYRQRPLGYRSAPWEGSSDVIA